MSRPLLLATQDAIAGLLPLLERLKDQEGLPRGTSPSHLRSLAAEALRRDDLPVDKVRGWLGYIQGVLTAQGHLDMDEERERTRPIFHKAYEEEGMARPPTVAVGEARGSEASQTSAPGYGEADKRAEAALDGFLKWTGGAFTEGLFMIAAKRRFHRFRLPSSAMLRTLVESLGHGQPNGPEMKARMDFMDRVLEAARKREAAAVKARYRLSAFGRLTFFASAIAIASLAGATGLASRSELLACALLAAMAITFIAGTVVESRRADDRFRDACRPPPPESYIPWL